MTLATLGNCIIGGIIVIVIICAIAGIAPCMLSSQISRFEETPEYRKALKEYLDNVRGEPLQ